MSDKDLRDLYESVRRRDEYVAPQRECELYTEVLGTVTDPYAEPQSNEIPERNVPLAELIKKLRDLGNRGLIDQEDINFFNKTLTTKPFKSKIIKHLNTHNISSDTLQTKDVVEAIITLLSNYKSVETYSQYIDKIKNLSDFPQVGNLVKQFSDIFPKEFITDLINLDGMEGGRGVGKGEIACSALFGDVSQGPPGAGDLVWNGEYLEVKGSAARLGGRDDSIDPRSYRFGQLMAMHQIQHETEIAKLIQTIWKKTPAKERQEVEGAIVEFITGAYPKHNIEISSKLFKFDDAVQLRILLNTVYFYNYANKHGVVWFIFINTKGGNFGDYRIFHLSDIPKIVKENPGIAGVIHTTSLGPNLNKIK